MKKVTAAFLCGAMLLPGVLHQEQPVHAESILTTEEVKVSTINGEKKDVMENVDISKEEAIKIAKNFMMIPKGYELNSVRFDSNWYITNDSVWRIRWRKQDENDYGNISITIDANTGDVVEMNRYENDHNENVQYPPKVDRQKAKEIAFAFITKHFSDKVKKLEYDDFTDQVSKPPLQGRVSYTIKYNRMVNDIPFDQNYISVRVNGKGEIIGVNYRWYSNLTFPNTEKMMSKEDAMKKIMEQLPLQLRYEMLYGVKPLFKENANDEQKVVLAYNNRLNYPYLDAKTGKWLNHQGEEMKVENISPYAQPIEDQPLADPPKVKKEELSKQEALEIVTSTFEIPEKMELENVSYSDYEDNGNQSTWQFRWGGGENSDWIHATVNTKTGEIIRFSNSHRYDQKANTNEKKYLTYEQAKKQAVKMLKKLMPHKVHQLTLNELYRENYPGNNQPEYYRFNFQRLVNNVVVPQQSTSITVSSKSGEITSFYHNWNEDLAFPDASDAISVEKAKEEYLSKYKVEAQYVLLNNRPYQALEDEQKQEPELKIVYQLRRIPVDEPIYLDAIKGKWVSRETGE